MDFSAGVIPDLAWLDMLRTARWNRFILDLAAVEHVSGGTEHCLIAKSEVHELEAAYSVKRDAFLRGEIGDSELNDFAEALCLGLFSAWLERGCLISLPLSGEYRPYIEEASSLAAMCGVTDTSDIASITAVCRVQRYVHRDLTSAALAAHRASGCRVGE